MTHRMLRWTGLTLLGVIGAFLLSFVAATLPARFGWEAEVRLDLALWLGLFGALGMAGVLAAARMAFERWPVVRASDVALPILGLAIAVAEEILLHEWAEASLGHYDWQFIGPTAGLSFAIVLVAIAAFGIRVAPEGASGAPRVVAAFVGAACVAIVLSNLPELLDGIGRGGSIAVAIGLAGMYAVSAVVLGLRGQRTG